MHETLLNYCFWSFNGRPNIKFTKKEYSICIQDCEHTQPTAAMMHRAEQQVLGILIQDFMEPRRKFN